jgi:radical SAM protein with 4Fe4S-binding SPASM domain
MVLKKLIQQLSRLPALRKTLAAAGIEPGLYHYMRESEGTFTRFHLRVDTSGAGMLLANATAAARLAPSGVIIAKGLLEGRGRDEIVRRLLAAFGGVTLETAGRDVDRVWQIIATLDSPGDNYPIVNLADPLFVPFSAPLDKPLGADLPLAEPDRLLPILDRLWDLGIPHVTFLAGEKPDAGALARVVGRAEDLGLIAGVRGRATELAPGRLIEDLAAAGADHVDVLYLSSEREVHDALAGQGDHPRALEILARVREAEVCPVADVALLRSTVDTIEGTLAQLAGEGYGSVSLFALATTEPAEGGEALSPDELVQAATLIETLAEEHDLRCLWYPPVRFDPGRPLAEQVRRGPRCSGDASMLVMPDGSVIPARGPFRTAGNLLTDDWPAIHGHEIYLAYRQRVETDTHCDRCPGLAICAADCPRNPAGWAEGGEL